MNEHEWVREAKVRGWGEALSLVLDVLEPLGPLAAQLLWVAQPALGLMVPHNALDELARALDEPEGVARLRSLLEDAPD
jgi:hypothetical protein